MLRLCIQCGRINDTAPERELCLWCYVPLPRERTALKGAGGIISRPAHQWPLPVTCRACAGPVPPRSFDCPRCGAAFLIDEPSPSQAKGGRPRGRRWLWVATILVVLLACLGMAAWHHFGPRSEGHAEPDIVADGAKGAISVTATRAVGAVSDEPVLTLPQGPMIGGGGMMAVPVVIDAETSPIAAMIAPSVDPRVKEALSGFAGIDVPDLAAWLCQAPEPLVGTWGPVAGSAYPPPTMPDDSPPLPTTARVIQSDNRPGNAFEAHSLTVTVEGAVADAVRFYAGVLGPGTRQSAGPRPSLVRLCETREDGVLVVTALPGATGDHAVVRIAWLRMPATTASQGATPLPAAPLVEQATGRGTP